MAQLGVAVCERSWELHELHESLASLRDYRRWEIPLPARSRRLRRRTKEEVKKYKGYVKDMRRRLAMVGGNVPPKVRVEKGV